MTNMIGYMHNLAVLLRKIFSPTKVNNNNLSSNQLIFATISVDYQPTMEFYTSWPVFVLFCCYVMIATGTVSSVSNGLFRSRWDTSRISMGSSNSSQIQLPLIDSGIYNFQVNWGDGEISII